jgi:hypothetical protein
VMRVLFAIPQNPPFSSRHQSTNLCVPNLPQSLDWPLIMILRDPRPLNTTASPHPSSHQDGLTFKVINPFTIQYSPPDFRSILSSQEFNYGFMFCRSLFVSSIRALEGGLTRFLLRQLLPLCSHSSRLDIGRYGDLLSFYYWSCICRTCHLRFLIW